MNAESAALSEFALARFERDGFLILKSLVAADTCKQMKELSISYLNRAIAPVEFEVDVQYPGSPSSRESRGGETVRRLLHAYARDEVFMKWATDPILATHVARLLHAHDIVMSQSHHNCIMTKHPGFSSATLWHQDIRYWSFDRPDIISGWLALGVEDRDNGCLRVIPGTHTLEIDRGRFDAAQFLRPDLTENKQLISQAQLVELEPGDVLLFHCRLFHAAGRNLTQDTKFSVVYTYHRPDNRPIRGTRSARYQGITIKAADS